MLDVGFHPMVWYPLQTMEKGGVRQVFLVAAGDASAATFSAWASESWKGTCEIVVVAAPEDADTADALRAVAPRLRGPTVVVAAGDLVTDVRLDDVLAAHVRRGAGRHRAPRAETRVESRGHQDRKTPQGRALHRTQRREPSAVHGRRGGCG